MALILLIENNAEINAETSKLLTGFNHEVISAFDGISGIKSAIDMQPDIIFCDLVMPNMSGYEILYILKRKSATAHIPFVFFATSDKPELFKKGLSMGALTHIVKPFSAHRIIDTINNCLA